MNRVLILPFLYMCALFASEAPEVEKEIVVVIPSYNNRDWYERNLFTVLNQDYKKFRVIYINDSSTDRTGAGVEKIALKAVPDSFRAISFDDSFSDDICEVALRFQEEMNRERAFFTLVNNKHRCGALENLYRAIRSCADDEIVVLVDGDDWLYNSGVLKCVNKSYLSGEVWMTHGALIEYPERHTFWSEPVPYIFTAINAVRRFKCPSHLRTFCAWLFKEIALKDLLYDGRFFPMSWDMAIMYPMLEMAAERHSFIDEMLYVYNNANQFNDNKVNAELQQKLDKYIRNMPPYQRLADSARRKM